MELHGNARLTPHGRMLMCQRVRDDGWTAAEAAFAAGCSERTCYRWLDRYDASEPMLDRSSAPQEHPGPDLAPHRGAHRAAAAVPAHVYPDRR